MPTYNGCKKRRAAKSEPKEIVLSVRIDVQTMGMLEELTTEVDRPRPAVAERAIREHASLCAAREGEK